MPATPAALHDLLPALGEVAVNVAHVYAGLLALLGAWGIHAALRSAKPARRWSPRRKQIVLVDVLFVVSCFGCAVALGTGRFRAWMISSIGICYLLMIPLPCYFEWFNRNRAAHAIRNALFVVVALALLAIAAGLVPLSLLGLA
jgi:hypothetical protein